MSRFEPNILPRIWAIIRSDRKISERDLSEEKFVVVWTNTEKMVDNVTHFKNTLSLSFIT